MELIHTHNNMEFQDVDSALGTFWSPDFEADSFNVFVSLDQGLLYHMILMFKITEENILVGDGTSVTSENASESRRKLAMQLLDQLEVLESSQKQPDGKWYSYFCIKQSVSPWTDRFVLVGKSVDKEMSLIAKRRKKKT